MNKYILLAICTLLSFCLSAQKTAKRELRGAWITTHLGLDWPIRSNTVQQKQAALLAILNQHQSTRMNAMYFQVRSQSDAMYESAIEPWAAILTASHNQGTNPGWDPLLYAISESHKRGMELHAWINPYRATINKDSIPRLSPLHVTRQHPEWMITVGKEQILNPGIPAVRDYLVSVITDIVSRYDVDGIHFDDYFYPNAVFNDDAAYLADPRDFPATSTGRADWRRDNVNILIKRVADMINATKPWVKFGVSPSGIYRSSTNPAIGSATSSGALQHYSALYADTKLWLQQGWVDYLVPQVYWYIGQAGSDYKVLIPWWNNQATNGRHIYIGQAIYKVSDPVLYGSAWANRSEIPNQMRINRNAAYPNVLGEIGFRTQFLRNNPLNVRDSIRVHIYKRPALPPEMPWRDNTQPAAPTGLTATKQANNNYILTWTTPSSAPSEGDKIRQFVVYRSETPIINLEDTANLLFITPTNITTYTDPNTSDKIFFYTVTAVDRGYVESAPSNVTDYQPPSITCPSSQTLSVDAECSVQIPDYTQDAVVSDDATPTQSITITQSPSAGTVVHGVGITVVSLTATDLSGKSSVCTFNVTTNDAIAPVITEVSVDPAILFPSNHKMRNVNVNYTATDNCGSVTTTLSVSSNETPATGERDWEIVNNHKVNLRAERWGYGSGRIYTITITAVDAAGNRSSQTVIVTVPHDRAVITSAKSSSPDDRPTAVEQTAVSISPNPSTSQFRVTLSSTGKEPVSVRVLDNLNRVVETRNGIAPGSTLYFGVSYKPGIYYIEISQAKQNEMIKVVKQ